MGRYGRSGYEVRWKELGHSLSRSSLKIPSKISKYAALGLSQRVNSGMKGGRNWGSAPKVEEIGACDGGKNWGVHRKVEEIGGEVDTLLKVENSIATFPPFI